MNNTTANKNNKVWMNLLLDIILPVMILNKLSPHLGENGPLYALLLAISLPLAHGIYSFILEKKVNWLSLLGLINVSLTGGFALLKLHGSWFSLKEASFPLLIGIFVLFSSFSKKPFFSFFLNQPGLFSFEKIQHRLLEHNNLASYDRLIRKCTISFSATFFLSALLNFVLAIRIFTDIPPHLSENAKAEILNAQIAEMTWMGYIVIALPLMILTTAIFYYCLKQLSLMTHMSINELMGQHPQKETPQES
jgi:hypothetical protein